MPSKPRRRPARPSKSSKRSRAPARTAARKPAKAARRPAKAAKSSRSAKKAAGKAAKKAVRKAAKRPAKAAKKPVKKAAKKAAKAARRPAVEFTEMAHPAKPLRIALFGASGRIGSRIAQEALRRGHHVTALVRNPDKVSTADPNVRALRGDVTDPLQVEVVARNHDVVASAISPPADDPGVLVEAAQALATGGGATGIRVVVVGGAGSLEVAPGQQLIDSPGFPEDWKPVAAAHRDALEVFRKQGGEGWTVVSPSALIEPGKRTGRYRTGGDAVLKDKAGNSHISMEDYAVAFVDELESRQHLGQRITVGY